MPRSSRKKTQGIDDPDKKVSVRTDAPHAVLDPDSEAAIQLELTEIKKLKDLGLSDDEIAAITS